jgi:hypothetical protein
LLPYKNAGELEFWSPATKAGSVAGLPDFFIQHTKNGRKYTKLPQNIPN